MQVVPRPNIPPELGAVLADFGASFSVSFGCLGDPELFLRCRAHPSCMHVMACLTLSSCLAAWFGCSWVGLGALGRVPGPVWWVSGVLGGPGGVLRLSCFLALVRTCSGVHDFQSSFILSSIEWQSFFHRNEFRRASSYNAALRRPMSAVPSRQLWLVGSALLL